MSTPLPGTVRSYGGTPPPVPAVMAPRREILEQDFVASLDDQTGGTPNGSSQLVDITGTDTVDLAKVEANLATISVTVNAIKAALIAAGVMKAS